MRFRSLGLIGVVLTLAITACGSDADKTTTTTTTTTTSATVATTPPPTSTTTTSTTLQNTTTTTGEPKPLATTTMIVVQQDLTALGYYSGLIDGIAGTETQAAIAKFQADAEIGADGKFGPITDAALSPRLQSDEEYVTNLQKALVKLEFYPGPVDGDYGRGTRAAVTRLQESCDLEETGDLDIRTRLCLGGHI